jgi:acetyltransferase-like isoleucine patch superfamily enzyme
MLLNIFRMKKSKSSVLYSNFILRSPWKIQIGSGSVVGHNCELDGRRGIKVGKNVNISSDVKLYSLQHDYSSSSFEAVGGKIVIEDYAWISARSIVLPGCILGKGCVVAAGAVVTKDVPEYTVVGGVPAKYITTRTKDLAYTPSEHFLPFA